MSNPPESPERFSLSRWSRRKLDAARERPEPLPPAASGTPPAAQAAPVAAAVASAPAPAQPLPPVESLTFDSDFRAYLAPKVDEAIKRAALKKLFSDPRFNVMDGLDIYIGDYTQPDPMPEGMLDKIADVYKTLTEKTAEEASVETVAAADAGVAPVPADASVAPVPADTAVAQEAVAPEPPRAPDEKPA